MSATEKMTGSPPSPEGSSTSQVASILLPGIGSFCSHMHEPWGRILQAAIDEQIPQARLESYHKMKRELTYLSRRQYKSADRVEGGGFEIEDDKSSAPARNKPDRLVNGKRCPGVEKVEMVQVHGHLQRLSGFKNPAPLTFGDEGDALKIHM